MTAAVLLRITGWPEQAGRVPPGGDVLTLLSPATGGVVSVVVDQTVLADPDRTEAAWSALEMTAHRVVDAAAMLGDDEVPDDDDGRTRRLSPRARPRRELATAERLGLVVDAAYGVLVEDVTRHVWRDEGRNAAAYAWDRPAGRADVTDGVRELERIGWLVPENVAGQVVYRPAVVAGEALAATVR